MGRPIKIQKGDIQSFGGSSNGHTTGGKGGLGAGLIEVTAAFWTAAQDSGHDSTVSVATDSGMYIASQKGAKKFKIAGTSSDGSTAVSGFLNLTPKAPGAIASGEFCVQAIGSDSTVYYVSKFHNRSVSVSSDAGSSYKHFGMSLLAEGTDEGQASSGYVNVDVQ
jgi:hypothetical protein|tara:strand:- start:58 stop:552 length:495 start_codon:yes stop_codon:yes gene_type:complete